MVECPFCTKDYTCASGLSHHLETGSCCHAPSLNRETILEIIRERDPRGLITNKQIEWVDTDSSTYIVSDYAWNGDGWECYLCGRCCSTRNGLIAHLNSPVHKPKAYRCPQGGERCGKDFRTLAALLGHLESETCQYTSFIKLQHQVDDVFTWRNFCSFAITAC